MHEYKIRLRFNIDGMSFFCDIEGNQFGERCDKPCLQCASSICMSEGNDAKEMIEQSYVLVSLIEDKMKAVQKMSNRITEMMAHEATGESYENDILDFLEAVHNIDKKIAEQVKELAF